MKTKLTSITITSLLSTALLLPALSVTANAAELAPDALKAVVEKTGGINGRALACAYPDIVSRAKAVIVARVAKTRELGETFEAATNAAFLAQGNNKSGCPARTALMVELETTVRPLNPPSTHKLTNTAEAPEVGINPRYLLQASNGRAIMDGDFKDRFQLITFGYTYCPDICPTSLLEMADTLKQLGDNAAKLQPIFISVDPARDTLAQLRTYTAFFDSRIIGVTGSPAYVKRAADNFKVRYEKVMTPGASPEHYAMDHSAGMFLLAPGGQFLAKFPYGTPVSDIVARLSAEIQLRADAPKASAKSDTPIPPGAGAPVMPVR